MQRVGDLDIDENPSFYRAFRQVERWAPWVLLVAVVAAALGAFGYGWLGRDTVSAGPLQVTYHRLAQIDRASVIEIQVDQPGETVELWLDAQMLSKLRVEQFQPEAQDIRHEGDKVVYRFPTEAKRMSVTIRFQFPSPGSSRLKLGLIGGPSLDLPQFVYP